MADESRIERLAPISLKGANRGVRRACKNVRAFHDEAAEVGVDGQRYKALFATAAFFAGICGNRNDHVSPGNRSHDGHLHAGGTR